MEVCLLCFGGNTPDYELFGFIGEGYEQRQGSPYVLLVQGANGIIGSVGQPVFFIVWHWGFGYNSIGVFNCFYLSVLHAQISRFTVFCQAVEFFFIKQVPTRRYGDIVRYFLKYHRGFSKLCQLPRLLVSGGSRFQLCFLNQGVYAPVFHDFREGRYFVPPFPLVGDVIQYPRDIFPWRNTPSHKRGGAGYDLLEARYNAEP